MLKTLKLRKLLNAQVQKYVGIATYSTAPQRAHLFDRNAKRLQKERAAQSADAAVYDYLKDEVGYHLVDSIFDIKRVFKSAVELGCNRGHLAKHILAECVEQLTVCDISPSMLEQVQGTPGLNMKKVVMDEQELSKQFPDNSLDLVVSSLSLHWLNDLRGCFLQIQKCLKPDGVFIASLFGRDTLFELRVALQLAEQERTSGISNRVSPFAEANDIGELLSHTGFTMLTIHKEEFVVRYPTMFELMWDLKGMAESNAAYKRPMHISRETLLAANAIYQQLYAKPEVEGIPATFEIIYLLGWKPAPSQPQPVERGSQQFSLKDLGRVIQDAGNADKKKA